MLQVYRTVFVCLAGVVAAVAFLLLVIHSPVLRLHGYGGVQKQTQWRETEQDYYYNETEDSSVSISIVMAQGGLADSTEVLQGERGNFTRAGRAVLQSKLSLKSYEPTEANGTQPGPIHVIDEIQGDIEPEKHEQLSSPDDHEKLSMKQARIIIKNRTQSITSTTARIFQWPSERFEIKQPFSLPVSFATRPAGELLQSEWVQSLKTFLGSLQSNLVNIVSSDYSYREVLLNWLISATIKLTRPLTNILVLSSDASLHKLLQSKGISCIHVPPKSLLSPQLKLKPNTIAFSQVYIMRLTVMRLINHWGFDVANYDTDAIILKNPEPLHLYHRYFDLIGSFGNSPKYMKQVWGVAVCMGAVMIRSTSRTELYWEEMARVVPDTTNDQVKLNFALKEMDVKWNSYTSVPGRNATRKWQGRGRENFTALILPTQYACRLVCKGRQNIYIWHKGGRQSGGKMATASRAGLWFLRQDWETITNRTTARGEEWMKAIATS